MELRVEAADGFNLPTGCFVGVRVGDILKQGKYDPACCYRFPAVERQRSAKIDLYQHLGTCCAFVDSDYRSNTEVRVSCLDPSYPEMRLKIHTKPGNTGKQREVRKMEVKKQARDYLGRHHIEERLSEAVKALLSSQPEDPTEFLCAHLRSTSLSTPGAKAPPTTKVPAPSNAKSPEIVPFAGYYRSFVSPKPPDSYMATVYAKFPTAARPTVTSASAQGSLASPKSTGMRKGAAALMRGFKTGEVDKLVDQMEADAAPQARPDVLAAGPEKFTGYYNSFVAPSPFSGASDSVYANFPSRQGATSSILQVGRNLRGLHPPAVASKEQLSEVERIVAQALSEFSGDFEGEYMPLPGSTSYPAYPDGGGQDLMQALRAQGLMIDVKSPEGRGVFTTTARDVAIWVNNDGCHAQFLVLPKGGDSAAEAAAWARLEVIEGIVADAVKQDGYEYVRVGSRQTRGPFLKLEGSLKGLSSPNTASVDQCCEAERVLARTFLEFSAETEGTYFPLSGSSSYFAMPGGMPAYEEAALRESGLLFPFKGPFGSGIFANAAKDFAVWVNEGHHVQILVKPRGEDPQQDKQRLQFVQDTLGEALRQSGYAFE